MLKVAEAKCDEGTVAKLDGMSAREIKVAVIKTRVDGFDGKDKSDDYVNARYDHIVETMHDDGDDGLKKALGKTAEEDEQDGKHKKDMGAGHTKRNDSELWKQPLSASKRA